MIAKGYWQQQPGAPQPYAGVPAVFAPTVATYHYYTEYAGGVPAPPGNWNAGATRGWFARETGESLAVLTPRLGGMATTCHTAPATYPLTMANAAPSPGNCQGRWRSARRRVAERP